MINRRAVKLELERISGYFEYGEMWDDVDGKVWYRANGNAAGPPMEVDEKMARKITDADVCPWCGGKDES